MDATHLADGSVVDIKRVYKHISLDEAGITQYLTHSSLTADTRNHCVPFYEMLQSPMDENVVFFVLPFLRAWNKPRFCTIGEAVDCIKQLIEVTLGNIFLDLDSFIASVTGAPVYP